MLRDLASSVGLVGRRCQIFVRSCETDAPLHPILMKHQPYEIHVWVFVGILIGAGRRSLSSASVWANNGGSAAAATAAVAGIAVVPSMAFAASGNNHERSFIMVKPDGVNRALVGEIIARFERKGYKLVGAKVLVPNQELAKSHYAEHDGKPFFPKLVSFLTSGPVVALVFEGKGVIAAGRKMIGATNPLASDPGTIRGDFGLDVGRNIIHGSDGAESAQREIALWFGSDEVSAFDRVMDSWIYEE